MEISESAVWESSRSSTRKLQRMRTFKGPNIMMGYYKNQELTDEVIKGGYSQGDIGHLDDDGFLITDRKKKCLRPRG